MCVCDNLGTKVENPTETPHILCESARSVLKPESFSDCLRNGDLGSDHAQIPEGVLVLRAGGFLSFVRTNSPSFSKPKLDRVSGCQSQGLGAMASDPPLNHPLSLIRVRYGIGFSGQGDFHISRGAILLGEGITPLSSARRQ